jgi:hypothetical protein
MGGCWLAKFKQPQYLKNERPTSCHLLFCFTSYVLNMFRTLIYPSSGACDCVDELPHRSSRSQFVVCWSFGAAGFRWCSFCRLKHKKRPLTPSPHIPHEQNSCASACKTNTTQNQQQQISNTQRTENKTTDVVIQQHSRKLLMMDILMSETCWAHKKWNKVASDIELAFHSSTIEECQTRSFSSCTIFHSLLLFK